MVDLETKQEGYMSKQEFLALAFKGFAFGLGFWIAVSLVSFVKKATNTGYILAKSEFHQQNVPYIPHEDEFPSDESIPFAGER